MNIIAFVDSCSESGESALFAKLAFNELNKENHITEMVFVGKTPPLHCTGCDKCLKNGICVENDSVNEWKKKLEEADGFIITGEIRDSGLCSMMYGLLERFAQMGRATPDFLTGKIGGLGVIGTRDGGMKAVFDIVSFFQHSNAILVWPAYWPFTWKDSEAKESFEKCDPEGVFLAGDLGRQMCWALSHS